MIILMFNADLVFRTIFRFPFEFEIQRLDCICTLNPWSKGDSLKKKNTENSYMTCKASKERFLRKHVAESKAWQSFLQGNYMFIV